MIAKKSMTRAVLIGPVLAALLGAGILMGCASDTGIGEGRDGGATATQQISQGESPGEHGARSESAGAGGGGSTSGSEEASGANLAPNARPSMPFAAAPV